MSASRTHPQTLPLGGETNPSPSGGGGERVSVGLAAVIAIALIVRLGYWLFVMPTADRGFVVDEPEYFAGAVVFASGRGFSFWDTFLWTRTPLYPAMLGVTFQLFGHNDLLPARLLQLGLSLASIAILYLIARRFFGPAAAVVSGLFAAIYLPFVILPYLLLGETLFILLFGLFLLAITSGTTSNSALSTQHSALLCALAGLFLGLATLVRGSALVYLPFAALVLWLNLRDASQRIRFNGEAKKTDEGAQFIAPSTDIRQGGINPAPTEGRGEQGVINHAPTVVQAALNSKLKTQNSKLIFAFLVVALITIVPWTVRNYAAYGHFILTDTTAGYNFWLGANGVRDGERLAADLRAIPNQGTRQDYAYARGFELLGADPLAFVGKGLKEMNDLWAGNFTAEERFTRGYTHGLVPASHLLASITLDDTLYLLLVPLAIVGLFAAPRHPLRGYVIAWALTNFALAFVFFAVTRFRLAVLFFLLPYAAWTLLNLGSLWRAFMLKSSNNVGAQFIAPSRPATEPGRDKSRPYRIAIAAVLIVGFLAANVPSYPLAETAQGVAEWGKQQHLAAGDALFASGDLQGAAREYNQADQSLAETQTAQANLDIHNGNLAAAQQLAGAIDPGYWGRYLIFGAIARVQHTDPSPAFINRVVRDNYAAASDWAWTHFAPTLTCDLHVGDEGQDMGNVRGFAPAEVDSGQRYRWSVQPTVSLRLCPASPTLTLRLRGYRPVPLPSPTVSVSIAGVNLGSVTLTADWQDYTIIIPAAVAAKTSGGAIVELSSSTFVPSGSDPRLLGFMLAEVRWGGK
jgi:Dolichyl-phosphate-mannose-protein mannosyltransferase